jgi:tripeptide aminopeptidase
MIAGNNSAFAPSVRDLAEGRTVRECFQWFTREKLWINERHIELCRIPAPTFREAQRAEWFVNEFRALGCESEIDRSGNVLARLAPGDGGPLVAVTAHLDTVLAPRTPADIAVDPGGVFHGPGVSDNGAGLAALLALARALKSAPPLPESDASLLFVANVCEEGEGDLSGMRYLAAQSPLAARIRFYITLDGPSLDTITCQALASRRFEIVFTGPGGHSWSDYGNPNAIHGVSRAIASFADWCTAATASANGAAPRTSYNVGTVEGGVSVNSIPAEARAKVDLRSEDNRAIEDMTAALAQSVERALEIENQRATGAKLAAKIREIGSRPGGRLPDDSPILQVFRAVDAYLGVRSRPHLASTDANIPISLGIPAVSIGAGGQGGAGHSLNEWFNPDGRDLGLKRILLAATLLLREA